MQKPVYKYITLTTGQIAQAFCLVDIDGNIIEPTTTVFIQGSVANYAALPSPASAHTGELWYVEAGSGGYLTWMNVYKYPKGLYSPNTSDVWEQVSINVKFAEDATTLINITNWAEFFAYAYEINTGDQIIYNNITYVNKTGTQTSTAPDTDTTNWGLPLTAEKHIIIKAENTKLGASSPTPAVIGNFSVLQFAGSGATREVYTSFHVPFDWKSGTDIEVHVHWAPVDGNSGDVVWQMTWDAIASDNNEVISGAGTTTSVTDATQSLQDELLETDDMTISGASLALEDTIGLKIFRDPDHGSDTYGSAASFVILEIKYTSKEFGG